MMHKVSVKGKSYNFYAYVELFNTQVQNPHFCNLCNGSVIVGKTENGVEVLINLLADSNGVYAPHRETCIRPFSKKP